MATTYTWVGGSGTWDNVSTANWSPAGVPTSVDPVIFNASSGAGVVTISGGANCFTLTATGVPATLKFDAIVSVQLYGSFTFPSTATTNGGNKFSITYQGTGTASGACAAPAFMGIIAFAGSGTFNLGAMTLDHFFVNPSQAVVATGALTILDGSLTNNGSLTMGAFTHTIGDTVVGANIYVQGATLFNIASSTLNIGRSGTGASGNINFVIDAATTSVVTTSSTLNIGNTSFNNGVINLDLNGSVSRQYNTINIYGNTVNSTSALYCANLLFNGSTTAYSYFGIQNTTVTNTFTVAGTNAGAYRALLYSNNVNSTDTPTPSILTLSGGAKAFTNVDCQDISLTTSGTAITYTSVGNALGCTNITFTAATTRYAVLKLASVQITSTAGAFSCTATTGLIVNNAVYISGTLSGSTGAISTYPATTVYYIIATNGTSTFTLSTSIGGTAVATTVGTTTGLTFTSDRAYSNTGMWSATSGGATGATAPLPQDTVIFNSNSGGAVVNMDMANMGLDVTIASGISNLSFNWNYPAINYVINPTIYGQPSLYCFTTLYPTGSLYLLSRSTISISSFNVSTLTVYLQGYGGTYNATGDITCASLVLSHGSFYTNNYTINGGLNIGTLGFSNFFSTASLYAGTSVLNIGAWVEFTYGTLSVANCTMIINSYLWCYNKTTTYGLIKFDTVYGGISIWNDSGSTFKRWTLIDNGRATFSFKYNQTYNVLSFELTGTKTDPLLFNAYAPSSGFGSTTFTGTATLNITNSVTTNYVAYRGIQKTGAGTFTAKGVADLGNNSGISFVSKVYGIAYTSGSGTFTVPVGYGGSSALVAIGGGGGGSKISTIYAGAGGGGAAFVMRANYPFTEGQTIYYSVGSGGAGATTNNTAGGDGGSSWINISNNVAPTSESSGVLAGGGFGASGTYSGLGQSQNGIGLSSFSQSSSNLAVSYGGTGGSQNGNPNYGGGGGGAAGVLNSGYDPSGAYAYGGSGGSGNYSAGGGGGYGIVNGNGTNGGGTGTNGAAGGANSSLAVAAGGTYPGGAGSNATLGGGGGGAAQSTTGSGAAGGNGANSADFPYTILNGTLSGGTIGGSGGGGGGGAAIFTNGVGGTGGTAGYGAGGAGGGGGTLTAGNASSGGAGLIIFLYTLNPSVTQELIIG